MRGLDDKILYTVESTDLTVLNAKPTVHDKKRRWFMTVTPINSLKKNGVSIALEHRIYPIFCAFMINIVLLLFGYDYYIHIDFYFRYFRFLTIYSRTTGY